MKPKAYQRGWVEFCKLKFKVSPDVLIPRPETELLVDEVVRTARSLLPTLNYQLTVIDLGTGSGCIAISLARKIPAVKIIAADISPKALKVAKQNARFHQVEEKITFLESDLLQNLIIANAKYSIVVANLPYIPSARIPYLDSSVKDYEPHLALDGGKDGFDLYRKLFDQMKEKNIIPKYFIGEIDYTHGFLAVNEVSKFFPKASVETKLDLAKKIRVLVVNFP